MERRPYFVEILGTPEAGKTTAIKELITSLASKGYDVQYIRESVEIVPSCFGKGSIEAHLWMKLHLAQELLVSSTSKNTIVIEDRGIIDTFFWDSLYIDNGSMSREQALTMDKFFQMLNLMPDIAIILSATPEESIRRRGGEGRIVTKEFVEHFNTLLFEYIKEISVPKFHIDTTNRSKENVVQTIESIILKNWSI